MQEQKGAPMQDAGKAAWRTGDTRVGKILLVVNHRSAATRIVKVKSHRGVFLNEVADGEASYARLCPPEIIDV